MRIYLDLVVLLNFAVDLLLIIGTNRLAGYPVGFPRAVLAAIFGGMYAASCMMKGFFFLAGTLWRILSLFVMSVIAFGCDLGGLRRCVLFTLLSMALGGIAAGMEDGSIGTLVFAAGVLVFMCRIGFRGRAGSAAYDLVELGYQGKKRRVVALRDTGNSLMDPITGENVLVVGADVGCDLLGLTVQQLSDPLRTVCDRKVTGLRLIPYRAVGKPNGMLLALRLDEVKINGRSAARIVAFAPENFDRAGEYQALTGGVL